MEPNQLETRLDAITSWYEKIPEPKYRHVHNEELKSIYAELLVMKDTHRDRKEYKDLVNALSQILSKLKTPATGWNNLSERGINKAIPPVRKIKNKEVLPFNWLGQTGEQCTIDRGYWGARNYMLMDILGYFFLLKEGGDVLPKCPESLFFNLDDVGFREGDLNKSSSERLIRSPINLITEDDIPRITGHKHWVRFDDKYFRKFTGSTLNSNQILTLILETSRVEFKLAFPVRLPENHKKHKDNWYVMNYFSRLFEFGYFDRDKREDGVVYNREYYVIFNTLMGEMFVNNLLARNYDWIPPRFYTLPDLAQFFYRALVLHHNGTTLRIYLSTIAERLNLLTSNITMLRKTVEINALIPLRDAGFIDSYTTDEYNALRGVKYIILRPSKQESLKGHTHESADNKSHSDQGTCGVTAPSTEGPFKFIRGSV